MLKNYLKKQKIAIFKGFDQCTEVGFTSFPSGGFTNIINNINSEPTGQKTDKSHLCKDFFRTCNVLPFSCVHLAWCFGQG